MKDTQLYVIIIIIIIIIINRAETGQGRNKGQDNTICYCSEK